MSSKSLLSYTQICGLIEAGVIQNADFSDVNSASLDLHLGEKILAEDMNRSRDIIALRNREPFAYLECSCAEGFLLDPGEFILAQTIEVFNLPANISAEYKLKSSMARIGLEHLNAGWCDAGWNGSVLTLELKNMLRNHSIELLHGDAIGQIVFFEHEPVPADKSYAARGRYNGDKVVTTTKTVDLKA